MQISLNTTKISDIVRRMETIMKGERADGTHVSELLQCIRKSYARRHDMVMPLGPTETLLFATGRAIQDYITASPAVDAERPITVDGVHGTPDYHDEDDLIWEIKATYASAARDVLDTPHYFDQLASYCAMEGKTKAYLAVFYINGYYNFQRKTPHPNSQPHERSVLKVFEVQFEPEELMDAWSRALRRRDILENATSFESIPVELHYTWECDYCPLYKDVCEGGPGQYRNHWV